MTKRWLCWVMVAGLAAAAPAWAQRADRELLRRQLLERPQRQPQGEAVRPNLRPGGQSRMTPDERRQLRQDIGNAGRDLYPRQPPPETLRR